MLKPENNLPAIIPAQTEIKIKPITHLNSDNFLDFLHQTPEFRDNQVLFPKTLNLYWLSEAMQYLYDNKQAVYLHTGESRDNIIKILETLKNNPESDSGLIAQYERMLEEQVVGERTVTFCYDPDDDKYFWTDIEYLEKDGGETSKLRQVFQEGGASLLQIHTHPIQRLPSFQDYQLMLIGIPEARLRILTANLVLCPGLQILALSTQETPISEDQEEISTLMSEHEKDLQEDPTIVQLLEELSLIYEEQKSKLTQLYSLDKNPNPEKIKQIQSEGIQQLDSIQSKFFDYESFLVNSSLIGIARKYGIKLYISHDMEHFREFSA